ncbi:MAG: HEAT repeat domain-containing protein, partial [Planctomycetota bacterium]
MHHLLSHSLRLLPCLLLIAAVTGQSGGTDPSADLRSKSVDTRLTAIDAIGASDRADADRLLLPLLSDKDWEIQERAAAALGKLKAKTALKPLIDLALDGDVVRIRQSAARAAAAIDAVEAGTAILKKAKGKNQVLALEALAITNRNQPALAGADKLEKLLRDKEAPMREAAAVAWLECHTDRGGALKTLLAEPFLVVRCRALDAVAAAPRQEDREPLRTLLGGSGAENDVVEQLLLRAGTY